MASTDLTLKSDYSACSVVDDIISKSLASQAVSRAHKRSTRISFRSLTKVIVTLIGNLKKASSFHEAKDIHYWRNLAESRLEVNNRYERLIKAQQNRIHTMETRLHTMINLAHETQKMLAEIGAEKRASEERGHGEHAD
ncbi:uncharacterized protein LOC117143856 [Drosophila mauritiana]|uniref:Uncharacterized protein LOC117143856 n=1 Tax=Drosophila mauritiana TaxID=7226 RepID=A0A6P8K6T5_DROMA|nr:uncharacterized protein LOC117143856 [Drosophila mauritiana]